jgi:hypothetical protein
LLPVHSSSSTSGSPIGSAFEEQAKVLAPAHAGIAMATGDERRALEAA